MVLNFLITFYLLGNRWKRVHGFKLLAFKYYCFFSYFKLIKISLRRGYKTKENFILS